jgi:hypothetical protein
MRTCNLVVAAAAIVLSASSAQAGHFCHHCGCERNCKKVCRLECGTKKETKTEYAAECEDFCVPGHSKKCGVKIECDGQGHHHRKVIWQPTCAKVHTRKKLVKKEVTKEVPDYKWVVEEYCCVCGQCMKVEANAKPGACAEMNSQRLPVAVATDEAEEPFLDEAPNRDAVAVVQVVADSDEHSREAVAGEALFVDDGDDAPAASQSRRPFRSLFDR